MKIQLEYDTETAMIYTNDSARLYIATHVGLETQEVKGSDIVGSLCKLKDAGFTADEIIQLNRRELI